MAQITISFLGGPELVENFVTLDEVMGEDPEDELEETVEEAESEPANKLEANMRHLDRSDTAKRVDESRNASDTVEQPISDEELEEWSDNKDTMDIEGVDDNTIF